MDAALAGADGLLPSTYLSVKADWSFGLAYINGFNLVQPGRCLAGPFPCCSPIAVSRGGQQQSDSLHYTHACTVASSTPKLLTGKQILL